MVWEEEGVPAGTAAEGGAGADKGVRAVATAGVMTRAVAVNMAVPAKVAMILAISLAYGEDGRIGAPVG
jgi:hypothetical protein